MSHLLQNHPGPTLIFALIAVAFLVVALALAFGWARQRTYQLEHAQRSVDAICSPDSATPSCTARSEMRSRPQ